jgi:hypothetical protein
MALRRVWIPSPNYSSRGGAGVRLIVLHTAEGARTYQSLGAFFGSASAQVSSQVGIDDTPGVIGEYVRRANKSWTQSAFNPVATSVELCAFSSWSTSEWRGKHQTMLENCAKWIAEEAAYFKIPIVKLSPSQAQGSGRGVCQHRDLGAAGGGHSDCGAGFPMDYVLEMARKGVQSPPPKPRARDNLVSVVKRNGALEVFSEEPGGEIFHRWQPSENAADWSDWQSMGKPG